MSPSILSGLDLDTYDPSHDTTGVAYNDIVCQTHFLNPLPTHVATILVPLSLNADTTVNVSLTVD